MTSDREPDPAQVIGDFEAEHPVILVNPRDPARGRWDAVPDHLDLRARPRRGSHSGLMLEAAEIIRPDGAKPEAGQIAFGYLSIAETRRKLRSAVNIAATDAWAPTLVAVHELGPAFVSEAIDRARDWPPVSGLTVPEQAQNSSFARQLIASEFARGNQDPRPEGVPNDPRSTLKFRYPIDVEAIEAEFEFDWGIEVHRSTAGPVIEFTAPGGYNDGWSGWGISGGREFPSARVRELRELWWREWRSHPHKKVRLTNPFRPEV